MDWPYSLSLPDGYGTIDPWDICSIGAVVGSIGTPVSATWPLANLAIYIPFRISRPILIQKAFLGNGTVVAGYFDIGVFSQDGALIIRTGTTAQTTVSSITTTPFANPSSTATIGPGLFYIGCSLTNSGGTSTVLRGTFATPYPRIVGVATQSTACPLPATITFASCSTSVIPEFGITVRSFV